MCKLIAGHQTDEQIQIADEEIEGLYKPRVYSGRDGEEAAALKNFEKTCIVVAQHVGKDAKTMTTMEFHEAVQMVKQQIKKLEKRGNKPHKGV